MYPVDRKHDVIREHRIDQSKCEGKASPVVYPSLNRNRAIANGRSSFLVLQAPRQRDSKRSDTPGLLELQRIDKTLPLPLPPSLKPARLGEEVPRLGDVPSPTFRQTGEQARGQVDVPSRRRHRRRRGLEILLRQVDQRADVILVDDERLVERFERKAVLTARRAEQTELGGVERRSGSHQCSARVSRLRVQQQGNSPGSKPQDSPHPTPPPPGSPHAPAPVYPSS